MICIVAITILAMGFSSASASSNAVIVVAVVELMFIARYTIAVPVYKKWTLNF